MDKLSCPSPSVINALQPTGFRFRLTRFPELNLWVKNVSIPGANVSEVTHSTKFMDMKWAGTKPEYDSIQITFIIDAHMNNYCALHRWLSLISVAESDDDLQQWIDEWPDLKIKRKENENIITSEGELTVLGKNKTPVRTIKFNECWITSLGSISLTEESSDTEYVTCDATIRYQGKPKISKYLGN